MGKSCTLNAILNEEAAARQFLNRETGAPVSHARESNEFTFTVIDTSGLTELDTVSTTVRPLSLKCAKPGCTGSQRAVTPA